MTIDNDQRMDPVASGLTIISAIRKAVETARKLYDAPRELEELQVEVETFRSVLNDVILDTFESRIINPGINGAIAQAQACLLEIQQLIEFELVSEVPDGKRGRRGAWVRRASDVHDLLDKLGECRANVILAFAAGRRNSELRSEAALKELRSTFKQKSEDIQRSLRDIRSDNSRNYDHFIQRWEHYERRWETHTANLQSQQGEYQHLCQLLEGLIASGHGSKLIEGPPEHLLLKDRPDAIPPKTRSSSYRKTTDAYSLAKHNFQELSEFPSEQVQSLIEPKSWIDTPNGGRRKVKPQLPLRVLDVGKEDGVIRLHEPISKHAEYATLSYCWGGTPGIVDSLATHRERKKAIPWHVLPRLFKDAITVVRKLGIQYLWIDVLCIIQDDVNDWERESGKMASIFGNATLTIVAGSTTHPSMPLMLPVLQIEESAEQEHTMAIDRRLTRSKNPTYNAVMSKMSNSNWHRRAWVLQETLLGPSSLYFVNGKIIFEDHEGFTPLMPRASKEPLQLLPHPDAHIKKLTMSLFSEASLPSEILELWWSVVEQYTLRKLTFQSDKLIAISGLASKFAGALGPYAAGLWPRYDFVRNLCWQPRSTSVISSTYVAPTWSWAKLDGPILPPTSQHGTTYADVVSHECIPLGQNPLGALKRAELTLSAPYVELEVRGQDNTHDSRTGLSQCLVYAQRNSVSLTFELDTFKTFHYGMKIACLKMFEDIDGDLTCMALTPATDGRWERIAVMQMQRRRGEHRWFGTAAKREVVIV